MSLLAAASPGSKSARIRLISDDYVAMVQTWIVLPSYEKLLFNGL
jgi:hypothetical protein